MAVCNSKTKSCIENQLNKCLEIIRKYEWLHSTLLHDFFVEKHWESIPKSWRSSLHSLSPIDLSNFLNYWGQNDKTDVETGTVLPLELLALKYCVSQYSIERQPVKNVNEALNLANLTERKFDVKTGSYQAIHIVIHIKGSIKILFLGRGFNRLHLPFCHLF